MKLLFAILFLFFSTAYSQEENGMDPLLDTDPIKKMKVEIPLYEIELENITIPIKLSYNYTGIKVNEIPSPTGLSWKLNDIGKISRKINHLPDEKQKNGNGGWFFSNDNTPLSPIGVNPIGAREIYENIDTTPDFFILNTATGLNSTFFYEKRFNGSELLLPEVNILHTNEKVLINTIFDKFNYQTNNYNDIVFECKAESGIKFKFIGGPTKMTQTRVGDSENHSKDFYVKTIESTHNEDIISFNYIENLKTSHNYLYSGIMLSDLATCGMTMSGDIIESHNTLEIQEISTPKETISFNYNNVLINTNSGQQSVKQLTEIQIYNNQNKYITGYKFEYIILNDNRFILSSIYKYDIHKNHSLLYKQLEYYLQQGGPNVNNTANQDMFGYSSAYNNEKLIPFDYITCKPHEGAPEPPTKPGANRLPDLQMIVETGMLRSITNSLGGITEYSYQLNADTMYYGGGLVISKIIEKDETSKNKTTTFNYKNLKGFVLPLNNYKTYFLDGQVMMGTIHPVRFFDTDPIDTYYYPYYSMQDTGNYFEIITTSIIYDKAEDGVRDLAMVEKYEYLPSYENIIRSPLLKKKSSYREYSINELTDELQLVHEEEMIYDIIKQNEIGGTKINKHFVLKSCFDSEIVGLKRIIDRYFIYTIAQPLRKKVETDYQFDYNNNLASEIKTVTEFKYLGESNLTYEFDQLRPKEITVYKNDIPFKKKKYTYLFEVITPGSGLDNLNLYNGQHFSLLTEESDWIYNLNNKWILKEAEHHQYFSDGKLKESSKVHKNHLTNSFYDEFNYSPTYLNGSLIGVTTENKINYLYNPSGHLNIIHDYENGKKWIFNRDNDKDEYTINTILEGNLFLLEQNNFYRNSFESGGINTVDFNKAYTGQKVCKAEILNLGHYPAGQIISFWYYKDNEWFFYSSNHLGGDVIIYKPAGSLYLDEVWVRPNNTTMRGYTYEPLVGTTSVIDDNGLVLKTYYDEFGREIIQADQDNNIIHTKEYNFKQD